MSESAAAIKHACVIDLFYVFFGVTLTRVPTEKQLQHEKIRAQRILDLEGAAPAGDVGPSRGKTAGRRRDTLADDLVIVEGEENKKGELSEAVYCIACDTRAQFRNPQRIKEHAVTCAVSHPFYTRYRVADFEYLAEIGRNISQALPKGRGQVRGTRQR